MEKTKNTEGFYDKEFNYAPNAVYFPGGTSLLKEKKDTYKYPVNDWSWFESIEDAYAFQGKTPPVQEEKGPKRPKRPE